MLRRCGPAAAVTVCVALGSHQAAAAGDVPRCTAEQLSMSPGPPISPETGEHGLILRLTNRADQPCTLIGYPGVTFYWRHRRLPFKAVWGGRYGTGGKPRRVLLRPGGHASFLVAKYRCDVGFVHGATAIRVYAPNTRRQLRMRLHRSDIAYCRAFRGPNSRDPGNTLDISPVSRANYPYG
jgi:Protein of unknown function (DUF4232)